jgi:TPR repeat protein
MRKIFIFMFVLFMTGNAFSGDVEHYNLTKTLNDEKSGVRYYKKGNYSMAYEKLSLPAQMGFKDAQYYLGFMYLKGQHVTQSIEIGMAWLGVASEIGIKDWKNTFNQVYSLLPKEQRESVDIKVDEYIEMYGMKTQRVVCDKKARIGSTKRTVNCQKTPDVSTPAYELESQPET